MEIERLPYRLTVAKIKDAADAPKMGFYSLTDTGREVSLVCETQYAPDCALSREDGWRAFCIVGQLDFSLVGILSKITSILAEKNIPLFALSTYNTDYVLVKERHFFLASDLLEEKGYIIL